MDPDQVRCFVSNLFAKGNQNVINNTLYFIKGSFIITCVVYKNSHLERLK